MTVLSRPLPLLLVATLALATCGSPSSKAVVGRTPSGYARTQAVSSPTASGSLDTSQPGVSSSPAPLDAGTASAANGHAGSAGAPRSEGGGTGPTSGGVPHGANPNPTGSTTRQGACPDPRYCADYALSGGHWQPDSSGRIVLHYRVNATAPAPANSSLTAAEIQRAIDTAAQTWMAADDRILLIDDGRTSDTPLLNGVIGFSASGVATEYGNADIAPTCNTCDTYGSWDIKLMPNSPWTWKLCDPAHGQPCTSYASTGTVQAGVDLQAIATHELGHVLGLAHPPHDASVDGNLTMYGNVPFDCNGSSVGCRVQDTLGLGDVLGVRALYATSAAMPTIYNP
jgi:hypothetical protein